MSETYDVLIVGAGSAGCVLANRLSASGKQTIGLIEAGGAPEDPRIDDPAAWGLLQGSAVDWAFRTTPQSGLAGRVEDCPRGRVLGGSTAIHAMGHMRGNPGDFDAWVAAGATGWDYETLLPYFMRSESAPFRDTGYGTDGPLHLEQPASPHPLSLAHIEAGAALGLPRLRDHNGGKMAGVTLNLMTIRDGQRLSASDAYLPASVRGRANLNVQTDVLVDQIMFDREGRAIGVVLANGDTRMARFGVILAAGSIATPGILMRSGFGPGSDLSALGIPVRKDLPELGANLQDHLLSGGNVYRASQPVPLTGTQHSEAMMYIPAEGDDPDAPPELVVGIASLPMISAGLIDDLPAMEIDQGYTLLFGITHPRSRGTVKLTSTDPMAAPEIDPRYLSHATDRALFTQALNWARRLGASSAYDAWRGEEVLPRASDLVDQASIDAFIARAAITHHHPIGTARMGQDANAPVTPELNLRGADGLYVVDGSILPSLTTGPVNAAIVAVAERAADLIGARL